MVEASVITPRPDLDIHEEIEDIIVHYPPMVNDRHHAKISVENGVVKLVGHMKTAITRKFVIDTISTVKGVAKVDDSQLFTDEAIKLEVGQLIPQGVFANVEYGVVILSGRLPQGTDSAALVQKIEAVPGVRMVMSKFI
jgi:osmotically-inducible protein OsmY